LVRSQTLYPAELRAPYYEKKTYRVSSILFLQHLCMIAKTPVNLHDQTPLNYRIVWRVCPLRWLPHLLRRGATHTSYAIPEARHPVEWMVSLFVLRFRFTADAAAIESGNHDACG
jgi:hypothetical protein